MAWSLWEVIIHVLIFGMIMLSFTMVVTTEADPEQYFFRYYGKDVGLIVEAMHAGRGEIDLTYTSLKADYPFIFNFTRNALYMSGQQLAPGQESLALWRVRRQYGAVSPNARPLLSLVETRINYPVALTMRKTESEIRFDSDFSPLCPDSENAVRKEETSLQVRAVGPVPGEIKRLLDQDELLRELNTAHPTNQILIDIRPVAGEVPTVIAGGDEQAELANKFECLIRRSLARSYDEINRRQSPQLTEGRIIAVVLLPAEAPIRNGMRIDDELWHREIADALRGSVIAFTEGLP